MLFGLTSNSYPYYSWCVGVYSLVGIINRNSARGVQRLNARSLLKELSLLGRVQLRSASLDIFLEDSGTTLDIGLEKR
jgi:hypothetical protein